MTESWSPLGLRFGDSPVPPPGPPASGRLATLFGEEFYVIDDAQELAPFFISVVSDSDHWLFAASNGALTAGRRDPSLALFPYVCEDQIYDSAGVTGPVTALQVSRGAARQLWRPMRDGDVLAYRLRRRLCKNVTGNRLVFEEHNLDLELCFRYEWRTSHRFGFVREATLQNLGADPVVVRVLDGLRNLLPPDVDEQLQRSASCLIDAYKKNEHVAGTRLGLYTLAAQVVDRPEPRESLHATTVWSEGLPGAVVHLCDEPLSRFPRGLPTVPREEVRGRRGAYFLEGEVAIAPAGEERWRIVADVGRSQADVAALQKQLRHPAALAAALDADVAHGGEALRRIVSATDGEQHTADRAACVHHTANVLFNDLRGGVYAYGYGIPGTDFAAHVDRNNHAVHERHRPFLESLQALEPRGTLLARVQALGDPELERLASEYLPLTFSRRHGDPSRPWNRFDIRVKDEAGEPLLAFNGNWRDIFQNWEALSRSHPDFVEHVIARFLNASTADGHNPYRLTHLGMDWEVPEPDHPWSSIGYWGDHQLVYLLSLLELSLAHHPQRLPALLERELYAYADVPYRLKPYAELLRDPRSTIAFDVEKHARIMARRADEGEDARLLHQDGAVHQVTLVEKLLVPALTKLASFVPGGGIWLNTQRPEWNDANNALVGYGLSVVTLCYLERYLAFCGRLLEPLRGRTLRLSAGVATWLAHTCEALQAHRALLGASAVDEVARGRLMDALGQSASDYRERLYEGGLSGKVAVRAEELLALVSMGGEFARHTIAQNRRADGLYHAYNVLVPRGPGQGFGVDPLYEMLEGQVAALCATSLGADEVEGVLTALASSRLYRADQDSYLLYPDRRLPSFLQKNVLSEEAVAASPLLSALLARGDKRIVLRDALGTLRFHESFASAADCQEALLALRAEEGLPGGPALHCGDAEVAEVLELYERVFRHREFTGRSGTMFAYEGLGSIYWHMVGKLLLAVQQRFFEAVDGGGAPAALVRLAAHYHAIRAGLGGVNKSPALYGAFPLDPYSHTPAHAGAKQPGMTGLVKEEILTRLGELGVRVHGGAISFQPWLLSQAELLREAAVFTPIDVLGRSEPIALEAGTLAFTLCQVPVVYHQSHERRLVVTTDSGASRVVAGDSLDAASAAAIFQRTGALRRLDVFTDLIGAAGPMEASRVAGG